MSLTVTDTRLVNSDGDHIQTAVDDAVTMGLTVTNILTAGGPGFSGAGMLGSGLTVSSSADYSGMMTYAISNSSIQDAAAQAININLGTTIAGSGVYSGNITSNTIGTQGSGSCSGGFGVALTANGNGQLNATVTGNTIDDYDGDRAIRFLGRDGSSTGNIVIQGNTVRDDCNLAFFGMELVAGASSTLPDAGNYCLTIGGDGALANTLSSAGGPPSIRVRQRFSTTVRLPGYAGAATDTAAVNAFVSGNNNAATTTSSVQAPGLGFLGVGCPIP